MGYRSKALTRLSRFNALPCVFFTPPTPQPVPYVPPDKKGSAENEWGKHGIEGLSGKLVGTSMRSKDLAKASGLDLRQPQGALAEGQCGLGREGYNRTGLE